MEIISKYSGLFAILVYSLILIIIVSIKSRSNKSVDRQTENEEKKHEFVPLNLDEEDAIVASLIASIECHNESHKNVQVLSVRRIS